MELIDAIYNNYIGLYDVSPEAKTHLIRYTAQISKALTKDKVCGACGASLKQYWHRLTPILVGSLVKMKRKIVEKNANKIHLINDLSLSKTEYNNFQKLRFHGLVAKYKVDGIWERGYWLITKRGNEFVCGRLDVPSRVMTYRNVVVDHDKRLINIKSITGMQPYVERLDDIEYIFKDLM